MIKVVIIEDEINSQELLHAILKDNYPDLKVLGFAESVKTGIALIEKCKPDIIFLDIEIQGGTGFDVLNAFTHPQFRVIFVTGYDHYALKAIKYSALDYILKPINLEELKKAISKIRTRPRYLEEESFKFLNEQISKSPDQIDQFVLSDNNGHNIIKFDDIIFIQSERVYCTFYLTSKVKRTATSPLRYYESMLPANIFFRIHKSYLINLQKVNNIDSGRGGSIHLEEGHKLPVAIRRKPALLKKIKK